MNFKKTTLSYVGQDLTEFPEAIFETPRVYKLNLSHNRIKEIPKNIAKLKFLEMLDLSGNQIRHLKAKLFDLPNLKILILNDNQVITLPIQIERLKQLKILHLASNKLSNLPVEITHLKNLEELNVAGNQLEDLPSFAGQRFPKLKSLWLAHNPLKKFTIDKLTEGTISLRCFYCYSPKLDMPVLSCDPIILRATRIRGNALPMLRSSLEDRITLSQINPTPPELKPIPTSTSKPVSIFISYAHEDREYLNRLNVHLKAMGHDIAINVWSDAKLRTSDKWRDEIENALSEATHAILLISADFLASDFIRNNELPTLLRGAKEKGTRIYPVIVTSCRFLKVKSLSDFEAVNSPEEPLSEFSRPKQDRIWNKLCSDIEIYFGRQEMLPAS